MKQTKNKKEQRRVTLFLFAVTHAGQRNGHNHQQKSCKTQIREGLFQIDQAEKVGKHHATQHEKQGVDSNISNGDDFEADEGIRTAKQKKQSGHEPRERSEMQRKSVHKTVDEEKQYCCKSTGDNIEQYADTEAGSSPILI